MDKERTYIEAKTDLETAAKDGADNWMSLARPLDEIWSNSLWNAEFDSLSDWLDSVSQKTELSPATLRRMRRAYLKVREESNKLDQVIPAGWDTGPVSRIMDPASGPTNFPYSAVDIWSRKSQGDSRLFLTYMLQALKRQRNDLSFPQLEKLCVPLPSISEQKMLLAEIGAGKSTPPLGQNDDLASALSECSGVAKLIADRYQFDWARVDAVALGLAENGVDFVDGYRRLKKIAFSIPPSEYRSLVAEVALSASFFRRYWVVTPPSARLDAFISDLDLLNLPSVGVGRVDDGRVTVIRRPSGPPEPDRRKHAVAAILEQGIPGLISRPA